MGNAEYMGKNESSKCENKEKTNPTKEEAHSLIYRYGCFSFCRSGICILHLKRRKALDRKALGTRERIPKRARVHFLRPNLRGLFKNEEVAELSLEENEKEYLKEFFLFHAKPLLEMKEKLPKLAKNFHENNFDSLREEVKKFVIKNPLQNLCLCSCTEAKSIQFTSPQCMIQRSKKVHIKSKSL